MPEDVPPAAVAQLGTIAEVVRLDRVARFAMTRASVQRGAALSPQACDPVAILASNSASPLPDNVVATVRDWAVRARPLSAFVGAVVVAATPEQAEFLRRHPSCRGEIAPHAFLFPPQDLGRVLQAAAKAGHACRPVRAEEAMYEDGWHAGESAEIPAFDPEITAAQSAASVRERLGKWAAAKLGAEVARPATDDGTTKGRTRDGAPGPSLDQVLVRLPEPGTRLPTLRDVTTAQIQEFLLRHPHVYVAVGTDPSLLALAMCADDTWLRKLDRLSDRAVIRAALGELREVVADRLSGTARPGGPPSEGGIPGRPAPAAQRAAPGGVTSSGDDPSATEEPWMTPALGELREFLAEAAAGQCFVSILYVNGAGMQAPRVVRPISLREGARPVLVAHCRDTNSPGEFLLERISAVRDVR